MCHGEDDRKSVSLSGNNTLDTEHSLQEHLRFKHNPKKFEGFLCLKLFEVKSDLMQHRKNEHNDEDRLECDMCNTMFKSRFSLERHKCSGMVFQNIYASIVMTTFVLANS